MSAKLRELLIEHVPTAEDVALLLSGGVDSLTCGFALEDSGCDIHGYVFSVNGNRTADTRAAEAAASHFGWRLTQISVPSQNLEDDFLRLSEKWKCQIKTDFECAWPLLYTIPEIEESYLVTGIGADGLYGMGREAAFNYRDNKEAFDNYRRNYTAGSENQLRAMCHKRGLTCCLPYREDALIEYFCQYDWYDLNQPHEKMHSLRAFPERFKEFGRRKHGPYQLVARIPTFFRKLLDSALNKRNRSRVMDLCHDYGKWNNLP